MRLKSERQFWFVNFHTRLKSAVIKVLEIEAKSTLKGHFFHLLFASHLEQLPTWICWVESIKILSILIKIWALVIQHLRILVNPMRSLVSVSGINFFGFLLKVGWIIVVTFTNYKIFLFASSFMFRFPWSNFIKCPFVSAYKLTYISNSCTVFYGFNIFFNYNCIVNRLIF